MLSLQAADAILNAQSLEGLNQVFGQATRHFGFDCYAVGRTPAPGAPGEFFLMTWPLAWVEFYAANGFVHIDPVVAEAQASAEPFTFREMLSRRPGEALPLVAAVASFGWTDGLVVPVHGPGHERGLVSMAATSLVLSAEARQQMVGLSLLTYRRARELALKQRTTRPRLTKREGEALALVARGYEDPEVAAAMAVSTATARNLVQRARERLGASTRAQAVAIAIVSRLI